MNESLKNETSIREYLLGRVSDETLLADYEELLFLDEDFCSIAEVVEDDLVNDFVFNRLSEADLEDFQKTLVNNKERTKKIALAKTLKEKATMLKIDEKEKKPSFFESFKAFFQKPLNIGAFAVVLIGVLVFSFFVFKRPQSDEIAELKNIYSKERPLETRISEFEYAPLVVTRGAAEERDKSKLRRIEIELLESAEKQPSAENFHKLGVFYLTQRKFDEAIKELEKAVKLNEKSAKMLNDLGSAHYEKAGIESVENKLTLYAKALENFSNAFEMNPDFLAALFNKALCLQDLKSYNQAKASWNLYLEKDSDSGWANEARKNLERLEKLKTTLQNKDEILERFLLAYRNNDKETAWKLICETRDFVSGVWLPDQLSRRFLKALKTADESTATEALTALKYIGNLEREKIADFFLSEMADFYENVEISKVDELLKAKDFLDQANQQLFNKNLQQIAFNLEQAKEIFEKTGNSSETMIANAGIAFNKRDSGQLKESFDDYSKLLDEALSRKNVYFTARFLSVQSEIEFKKNNLTEALRLMKKSFQISEEIGDTLLFQKNASNLGSTYQTIGELEVAAKYFSRLIYSTETTYESQLQKLRNFWYLSTLLRESDLPHGAVNTGEEALFLAKQLPDSSLPVFDSTVDLGISYTALENWEKAVELAKENVDLGNKFEEAEARNFAALESNLQAAHIYRLIGNCEQAVLHYDISIDHLDRLNEYQIDTFTAHKGRLICYENLNRQADFEKELPVVMNLFEDYRNKLFEEESRNAFFAREQSVANIAANHFLKQNELEKAFDTIENSKARSLLDLIKKNGFYDQESRQIIFKESAKPFTAKEIQKSLEKDFQILQYAVFDDRIVIWLISKEKFISRTVSIPSGETEKAVKEYIDALKGKSFQNNQKSSELYKILIEPIFAELDKTKPICFVPDGILYHLPFASLISGETGKYLIEDFPLFYAPSSTLAIILTEKADENIKEEKLLAIGNPDFNRKSFSSLQSLPSAEKEAEDIASFYPTNKKLIGKEALKNKIFDELKKADIFHFAGHYISSVNSPLNSKLLLAHQTAGFNEFSDELRAFEILQLRQSHLKLAVLSACETGIERYYKGEGSIGMARTFLAVGTPAVVASHWKVESEPTAQLMFFFHRNRKQKGLKTIQALQRAQIEMIESKDFPDPSLWSAFSVIGGAVNY